MTQFVSNLLKLDCTIGEKQLIWKEVQDKHPDSLCTVQAVPVTDMEFDAIGDPLPGSLETLSLEYSTTEFFTHNQYRSYRSDGGRWLYLMVWEVLSLWRNQAWNEALTWNENEDFLALLSMN